jgi:hypothetical protein
MCIAVFTLDAALLARSQYPEGPTTGLLDTGFLVSLGLKANAEVVPNFPSATTRFSCSPPDLKLVVINVIFCIHVK